MEMKDVDDMEHFFTIEINWCLDSVIPWKTRKIKRKKYYLPKAVQLLVYKRNKLQKIHKENVKTGKIELDFERKYKKHSNYCNKVIKKAVQEKTGGNITSKSNSKEI